MIESIKLLTFFVRILRSNWLTFHFYIWIGYARPFRYFPWRVVEMKDYLRPENSEINVWAGQKFEALRHCYFVQICEGVFMKIQWRGFMPLALPWTTSVMMLSMMTISKSRTDDKRPSIFYVSRSYGFWITGLNKAGNKRYWF